MKVGEIVAAIKPFVVRWIGEIGGTTGTEGYAPSPHDLSSAHHTGSLADAQGPQFVMLDGSRTLTGNLPAAATVTVDGVDISVFKLAFDTHAAATAKAGHSGIGEHTHQNAGEGGQLDHGAALSGLGDDDHTQYLNTTRHDTTSRHAIGTVVPSATPAIVLGTAATAGDANSVIRSNATIVAFDVTVPTTIQPDDAAAAGSIAFAARRDHKHAIVCTAPGANSVNLSTSAEGTGTSFARADHTHQLDQSIAPTWTGAHTFQATITSRSIVPELTDTYDLGTSLKLWRKGWLSELDAILFAQNTITLLGGWFMVTKDEGALPSDVTAIATTIDFGKAMTPNDFVLFRAALQVEYMQVGTLVGGTTYNVTRNLDGSGANAWPAGSVFAVLGYNGNGRIELNAYDTPRINILTQGTVYNSQTELIRLGDLNGNWGYSSATYGLAIGEYAASKANLTIDPTNGLRIRTYNTTVIQLDQSGNADITGKLRMPGASSAIAIGSTPPTAANAGTGIWLDRTGLFGLNANAQQVYIQTSDGKLYAGAGGFWVDATGVWSQIDANTKTFAAANSSGISWGGVTLDVGDVLIGHNKAGKSCMWWDSSVGRLEFRAGGNAYASAYVDSSGNFGAGAGCIVITSSDLILAKSTLGDTEYYIRLGTSAVVHGELFCYDSGGDTYAEWRMIGMTSGLGIIRLNGSHVQINSDTRVLNGLYVGSNNDPTDNDIIADGGIYLGRNADPGDGNVAFTGVLKSYKNSTEYTGYPYVPLATPLTSTSYDGDAFSDVAATLIDLSAVFGAPAGIKAAMVQIVARDSAAWGTPDLDVAVGPSAEYFYALDCRPAGGDVWCEVGRLVTCDANGDLYLYIDASGVGTMDVYIRIWGYCI